MIRACLCTVVLFLFPVAHASAAELKLLPADIALTGAQASQRLIVLTEDGGQLTADLTAQTRFTSSNPAVATVDETGVVKAAGYGEAVITARHGGRQAAAKVKV